MATAAGQGGSSTLVSDQGLGPGLVVPVNRCFPLERDSRQGTDENEVGQEPEIREDTGMEIDGAQLADTDDVILSLLDRADPNVDMELEREFLQKSTSR